MGCLSKAENSRWPRLFAAAVFVVYGYYLPRYIFPEIWNDIYYIYDSCLIPVLLAFTLYFRRLKEPIEVKLILVFWGWVLISRFLNGDYFLTTDIYMVIDTGLIYLFLVVCIQLKGKARERFLDWISIITTVFYTLVALVCLYAVLFRKELYNPFTGAEMCGFMGVFRLSVFSINPNSCCIWFLLAFFLLIYLFFRTKKIWWRAMIVLAAALNYVILGMTFSRNGRLAFSLCMGLLVAMLLFHRFPGKALSKKLLITAVALCLVMPLAYKSFNVTALSINRISAVLAQRAASAPQEEIIEEDAPAEQGDAQLAAGGNQEKAGEKSLAEEENMYIDNRGFEDTGRIPTYKSIIPTMQREPLRLLRGCLSPDVMSISNTVLSRPKAHMRNTFLQILCLTGLPGFLLILAFCALLAIRIIRLFFSDAPLTIKTMTLLLIGSFSYNMLEVSLFVRNESAAFLAYIVAGAVLAYSYEAKADRKAKNAQIRA